MIKYLKQSNSIDIGRSLVLIFLFVFNSRVPDMYLVKKQQHRTLENINVV